MIPRYVKAVRVNLARLQHHTGMAQPVWHVLKIMEQVKQGRAVMKLHHGVILRIIHVNLAQAEAIGILLAKTV